MKRVFSAIILIGVAFTLNSQATIIRVPGYQPTIQAGIMAANTGDTVLVDPGTYIEAVNFNGRRITVGSWYLTTSDTSYISQTIIDGNNSWIVVTFNNGEDNTAKLVGFTVRRGAIAPSGRGIICMNNSQPMIISCRVRENSNKGIHCNGSSPRIINCQIVSNTGSGIYVEGTSSPIITGCQISSNTNCGIQVVSSSGNPIVTGNSINQNGNYPTVAYANQIGGFSGNSYLGNAYQKIYVAGGTITQDATWVNDGIPYMITSHIFVQGTDGADAITTLTVQAGANLAFCSQFYLWIGHDSNSSLPGALVTQGTCAEKVTFTADIITPIAGYWCGIYFANYASDLLSDMNWAVVEYGGYSSYENIYCNSSSPRIRHSEIRFGAGSGIYCYTNANPHIDSCLIHDNTSYGVLCENSSPTINASSISANSGYGVYINGTSSPSITGCQIFSNTYGIYVNSTSAYPMVTGNSINNNSNYPVRAYATQIARFHENTYSGNTYQQIYVTGGVITQDATWVNDGIPYKITNSTHMYVQGTSGADGVTTLTINSGATLAFDAVYLWIGHDSNPSYPGALVTQGTEEQKVIFTADTATPSPGYWYGIYFANYSRDSLSEMNYTIVEYGGTSSYENIWCNSSSPYLNHIESRYAAGAGIYCQSGSNPTISECRIYDNTSQGVYCNASSPTLTKCVIYSNDGYGISTTGASTSVTATNNTITENPYGVYLASNSTVNLNSCILWNSLTQSISSAAGCTVRVAYSDVAGGFSGMGNINSDPQFLHPSTYDYRLAPSSPCINTGDPALPLDPNGSRADMGAYWFDQAMGSAVITSVADVPEDQGRHVLVSWQRSPFDYVNSLLPIVGYNLWEMYPFGNDGGKEITTDINQAIGNPKYLFLLDDTTWVHVTYLAAMQWQQYHALATTFRDSSSVEDNPSVFFVSAHTTTPWWYFTSDIAQGYSVDNIPPNEVDGLVIAKSNGQMHLSWSRVTEGTWQGNSYPELNGVWYRVYGNPEPRFTPSPINLLFTTQELGFLHTYGELPKYFYIIKTSDDH